MNVLLSIKPCYASKIFSGVKKFEYRKKIFQRKDIEKVIVYASAPISKIIGEFLIEKIWVEDINKLWELTKQKSGISHKFYLQYFENSSLGYAIEIKSYQKYELPISLDEAYGKTAPQSFVYIE